MTMQLINNITAGINSAFYAAEDLYIIPRPCRCNVKEILKGHEAGDKEKMLDHTFHVLNVPVSTGYAATSCALSYRNAPARQHPFFTYPRHGQRGVGRGHGRGHPRS